MSTQYPSTRRSVKTSILTLSLFCLIGLCSPPAIAGKTPEKAPRSVNLTPRVVEGDVQHAQVLFELDGALVLKSDTQGSVKAPVQAKARLSYNEKVAQGSTSTTAWPRSTVRAYETAKATIKLRDRSITPSLRENRQLIVSSAQSAEDVMLFSPLGPLRRDELDLIDVPANSAIINGLLPRQTVKIGETWELQSDLLPAILGVDAIASHDIQCRLARIENGSAVVEAEGTVSGASGGVATEIRWAAKYAYDVNRQRIAWFAMSLKENRSMGHAQPGLDATVRLQMALSERSDVPALHADSLSDLELTATPHVRLMEFVSPNGKFELLMSRKWHEMLDREDACVLRLVDRGDLVAQCNLTALPPMEDGVPFTLSDFQSDIKNVLDKQFGEFVSATEKVNENGLHVMRVVVNGMVSEVPINWVYYHLTNDQGRRASCVFTFESDLASRFGPADQDLISSFRFREPLNEQRDPTPGL